MTVLETKYEKEIQSVDALLQQSLWLKGTSEFVRMFDLIGRLSHYSRYNTLLVYLQNNDVEVFGGAGYWKKNFGRLIKKGARPYIILAPKGPVMVVYDVVDTTGEESVEAFLERVSQVKSTQVSGSVSEAKLKSAIEESSAWGIKVRYELMTLFEGGYITTVRSLSEKPTIALKKGMTTAENVAVLVHELAHLLLGHTGHTRLENKSNKKHMTLVPRTVSRNMEELEAEVTSFLVCKRLGFENRSAKYLAGYIRNDEERRLFPYDLVIKTAEKIENRFFC